MQPDGVTLVWYLTLALPEYFLLPYETHFSYHKTMWINATNYYICFFPTLFSALTAILQILNRSLCKFYNFMTFTLQNNTVILTYNCHLNTLVSHT